MSGHHSSTLSEVHAVVSVRLGWTVAAGCASGGGGQVLCPKGSCSALLPVRKLAVFDTWSALAVHIAMDNTVVMEDISE